MSVVGNILLDFIISAAFLGTSVVLIAVVSDFVSAGHFWSVMVLITLVSLVVAKYMAAVFGED